MGVMIFCVADWNGGNLRTFFFEKKNFFLNENLNCIIFFVVLSTMSQY